MACVNTDGGILIRDGRAGLDRGVLDVEVE
jgi:hypothetical protein